MVLSQTGQILALVILLFAWVLILSIWLFRIARRWERGGDKTGTVSSKSNLKVGLVRFNPFSDTGGDQSFALSLLDSNDSGVVLLSLHAREGTRIYVKPVSSGKSKYELSSEEKQAVEQARKWGK